MAAVQPRSVATRRGTAWIGDGYGLFRKAPGTWIGIALIWIVISAALKAIPRGLGDVINLFLNPVFQAGIVLGCASLAKNEPLKVEHLFAAFRGGRLGPLLMMSVILLLMAALAVGVGIVLVAGTLEGVTVGGAAALKHAEPMALLLAVLVILALALPLFMFAWFAPALIVLDGVGAWEAMKLSFRGCIKNVMPFLVYGLVAMAMLIVACIPLLLGLLIAVPVLAASVYTSYRDIFPEP